MTIERPVGIDLHEFESQYLCLECGAALYGIPSEPGRDVCLTSGCPRRDPRVTQIIDVSSEAQPQLLAEADSREAEIAADISRWRMGALARRTWAARRDIIAGMFNRGAPASFERFGDLEELLILLNKYPQSRSGYLDTPAQFEALISRVHLWADGLRDIEAFQSRRYAMAEQNGARLPLALKYEEAIRDLYQTFGQVNQGFGTSPNLFRYEPVEQTVIQQFESRPMDDWSNILAPMWPFVLTLRYVLEASYRSAQQHRYQPDVGDMSVIFGWYMTLSDLGPNGIIPTDKLENEVEAYQRHFEQTGYEHKSVSDFISKYITSPDLAPVIVASDRGWHIDRPTTLFYVLYLQNQLDRDPQVLRHRGRGLLDEARDLASGAFEVWLRGQLEARGFKCLAAPLKLPTARRVKFEYDIVAVSEATRRVLIADAKYRDPPPSSFTGENLVAQEFGGRDGLAAQAQRQQQRMEYFRNHVSEGIAALNPEHSPEAYQIESYLVTKHIPLVHKYRETFVLRAFEFLNFVAVR